MLNWPDRLPTNVLPAPVVFSCPATKPKRAFSLPVLSRPAPSPTSVFWMPPLALPAGVPTNRLFWPTFVRTRFAPTLNWVAALTMPPVSVPPTVPLSPPAPEVTAWRITVPSWFTPVINSPVGHAVWTRRWTSASSIFEPSTAPSASFPVVMAPSGMATAESGLPRA